MDGTQTAAREDLTKHVSLKAKDGVNCPLSKALRNTMHTETHPALSCGRTMRVEKPALSGLAARRSAMITRLAMLFARIDLIKNPASHAFLPPERAEKTRPA